VSDKDFHACEYRQPDSKPITTTYFHGKPGGAVIAQSHFTNAYDGLSVTMYLTRAEIRALAEFAGFFVAEREPTTKPDPAANGTDKFADFEAQPEAYQP